jgi:hypothetical protein
MIALTMRRQFTRPDQPNAYVAASASQRQLDAAQCLAEAQIRRGLRFEDHRRACANGQHRWKALARDAFG